MARKQDYKVCLAEAERDHLKNMVSSGVDSARKLTRARILLKADEGWIDKEIVKALDVGKATVGRIRQKYAEGGLENAINPRPSIREYKRKFDGKAEAHLIALVCGDTPEGYAHWSLRLLAEHVVQLEQVEIESVSHETVRQTLKKTILSLGKTSNG